ncbi:MAG: class I SAM-dependent methyltransferase [Acidobacteriota bacterium]
MNAIRHTVRPLALLLALALAAPALARQAADAQKPFEPQVGQAGKDVVWVPTPQVLVERMLDMAKVTPQDFLMDLGSGDGRTVITAAKRGIRALGIEYNPDMVALSRKNAAAARVSDLARFEEADLFETDLSKAQVITMFLLPSINMKLRPTLLNLKPGTRIVSNSFTMEDWQPDETQTVDDGCESWCTAHLWIVPAKVEGAWQLDQGTLTLSQQFQRFTGTLDRAPIDEGRLRGAEISFRVGDTRYTGTVNGNRMGGTTSTGASWSATKR